MFKGRSSSMAAPSTSGFQFGAGASASNPSGSGSSLFNTNNQNSNVGGGSGSGGFSLGPPAQNVPNTFGSNNATGGSTGGLFGNANTNSAGSGGGLFGNQTTTSNANTGANLFGNNNSSANKPLFGNASTNAGTGGLFGNTNTSNTNSGGGLFGNANTNNANPTSNSSLFGNSSANTGGGLFGNATANNTTMNSNSSLFGNNTAKPTLGNTGGGSLFGNANNAQQSSSIFGGGSQFNNSAFGNQSSNFSATTSTPNQSVMSIGTPLVTTIDQASYSFASSVNSTVDRSLGPLTASRRGQDSNASSAVNTPTAIRRNNTALFGRAGSLKAAPSPRATLNSARSSPYQVARRREQVIPRTKSMFFQPTRKETIRSERSFDNLALSKFTESQISDVRRLVINRKTQRPLEQITGRTSSRGLKEIANGNDTSENHNFHSRNESMSSIATNVPSTRTSPKMRRMISRATFKAVPEEHGRVIEFNKTAQEQGYWISPNLQQLYNMTPGQLQSVQNLSIGRKKHGQIRYNQPVDLSKVDLGSILGNIVVFGPQIVCVYPDESTKAPRGQELNLAATVTLENVWVKDKRSRERISDPGDPRVARHVQKLTSSVESKGGEFVTYDVDYGTWTFRVPHFSIWGLTEEDVSDDEEDEEEADLVKLQLHHVDGPGQFMVQQQQQQQQQQVQAQPEMRQIVNHAQHVPSIYHFTQSEQQPFNNYSQDANQMFPAIDNSNPISVSQSFEDTFGDKARQLPSIFGQTYPENVEGDDSVQVEAVHQVAPPIKEPIQSGWGISESNLVYGSDEEEDDDDELIDEPRDLQFGSVSNVLNELDNDYSDLQDDGPQTFNGYVRPTSKDWITQLQYSSHFDSPLARGVSKNKNNNELLSKTDNFTAADLDNLIFGGSSSLDRSVAQQYHKAAEELRLPDLHAPRSLGIFSPGTGKFLTLSSRTKSGVALSSMPRRRNAARAFTSEFTEQLKQTELRPRDNHIPIAVPNGEITFALLLQQFKSAGASRDEIKIWELASILFDSPSVTIPYGYSELAEDKIREKWRRKKLSSWLEDYVASVVKEETENQGNDPETILTQLSGHRIVEACTTAVKSKYVHLATLIPMLGTVDRGVREDARKQLSEWVSSKSINDIPVLVRKVYELLSGNTTVSQGQKAVGTEKEVPALYLSENLDWLRAFGLRLWYETSQEHTIAETVEKYRAAFENKANRVAAPLEADGKKPALAYQLLRLYGALNPSLASVLESDGADYRLPWHFHNVLVRSSKRFKDVGGVIGDRLSINYACQLESEGRWNDALFVLVHVQNAEVARKYIQWVLSHHVDEALAIKQKLESELGIDPALVCEAKALKCRYNRDHLEEAYQLIDAGLWQDAHRTVTNDVAPRAVIEDRSERLIELLTRFKQPSAVASWRNGGQIYLDYARFKLGQRGDGLLERLLDSLSRISIDNFDIRVAASIMSNDVGEESTRSIAGVKNLGERVLAMKMTGSDYLQQTVDLSFDYFKHRLESY